MSTTGLCLRVVEGIKGTGFRLRPKTEFVKTFQIKSQCEILQSRREFLKKFPGAE